MNVSPISDGSCWQNNFGLFSEDGEDQKKRGGWESGLQKDLRPCVLSLNSP